MGDKTRTAAEKQEKPRKPGAPRREAGSVRGLRIRTIHWTILLLGAALVGLFLFATRDVVAAVRDMETAIERFASAELAANDLWNASANMTNCVRVYAATADPEALEEYFHEAFQRRRREHAVETLREKMEGTEAELYLERALEDSNQLMEVEYHSMKLIAESVGYTPRTTISNGELGGYVLPEEETGLSPEEKTERGRDLVFSDRYEMFDDRIEANVSACMRTLDAMRREVQQTSGDRLDRMARFQLVLAVLLLAITTASILSSSVLVILPLNGYVRRITKFQPLPLKGAYELRYLAVAYNAMYEENRRSSSKLRHEAEHDPLTGLYNRGAFVRLRQACRPGSFAMILIDVDLFKSVNDTYGHDTGDQVLQKVAELLRRSFRATDYPCRIGGDEFTVIMTDVKPELKGQVREKLRQIQEKLRDTSDGLPRTTLSIGAAFGTEEQDVYKCADAALYYVKEHGRDGCAFYEDLSET